MKKTLFCILVFFALALHSQRAEAQCAQATGVCGYPVTVSIFTATGVVSLTGLTSSGAVDFICFNPSTFVLSSSTANCPTSSERYKHDFEPLDSGLDTVLALETYSYVSNYHPEIGRQVGLKAENVATVEPRIVQFDSEGKPERVNYEQYTAILTKAMQEMQAEIVELRRKVNER